MGAASPAPRAVCGAWNCATTMAKYNHMAGFEDRRRDVAQREQPCRAGRRDGRIRAAHTARHLYWGDNDKKIIDHAIGPDGEVPRRGRRARICRQADDTAHMAGTAAWARPARQRDQRRRPHLGRPEFVGLRRVADADQPRRQSVADDPGERLPHRRPHPRDGEGGANCESRSPRRRPPAVLSEASSGIARRHCAR